MAEPRNRRRAIPKPQSASAGPVVVEGMLSLPPATRIAIVASRFNHFIVDRLVEGATDAITRHGGSRERLWIVRVPGSWELSQAIARVARSGKVDAIVALGAVIRGATPHFDYIAAEVSKGIASIALQTAIPISFGILTTDTIEQAVERAGTKSGNKGWDAAVSAIEMVSLAAALDRAGL